MPSFSTAFIYWLALQCAWTVQSQEHGAAGGGDEEHATPTADSQSIEKSTGPLTAAASAGPSDVFENACVSDIEACGSVVSLLQGCQREEDPLACRCQPEITSLEHICHYVDKKQCQGTNFNPATVHTDVLFYGQCEGGAEAWAEAVGTALANAEATGTHGSGSHGGSSSHGSGSSHGTEALGSDDDDEDDDKEGSGSASLKISAVALIVSLAVTIAL